MGIAFLLPLFTAQYSGGPSSHLVRDEWRYLGHGFDLDQNLKYSLKNAPLSSGERERIYRVIDGKTIHDSFANESRNEEREVVLNARVGLIALAEDGSQQLVVRGSQQFCGASANCSIWIFVRHHAQAQLVLTTGGQHVHHQAKCYPRLS